MEHRTSAYVPKTKPTCQCPERGKIAANVDLRTHQLLLLRTSTDLKDKEKKLGISIPSQQSKASLSCTVCTSDVCRTEYLHVSTAKAGLVSCSGSVPIPGLGSSLCG